jgi:hypothetical protein
MDIKKSDRTALKSYFVRNAVPTASNFADLIDGAINQKEDGIAKLPGEPVSLQADGGDTSQKKVINFYKDFADPKPAWTISLNPRSNPNDAASAKSGWSVGDADGNSRVFIDQSTGNVGIGTVDPGGYKLNVQGSALFNGNYLYVNSESAGRLRVGAAWGMPGLYSGDDGAKSLSLGVPQGQKVYLGVNQGDAFVEGGTGNAYLKGNVGIGTNTPVNKLDVMGDVAVEGKHALRGNDSWLRLNQDLKFTSGTHTPGVFAPMSLNVGGVNNWGNPGNSNAWIGGSVTVNGSIACGGKIWIRTYHSNNVKYIGANPNNGVVYAGPNKDIWESFTLEMGCSRDIKENICILSETEAMATLQSLSPVKYDYKGEKLFRQNLGFIAEDMPDNLASENRKTISPFEVTPILTKVAQEQHKLLLALQDKIRALEAEVKSQQSQIEKLRAPCC